MESPQTEQEKAGLSAQRALLNPVELQYNLKGRRQPFGCPYSIEGPHQHPRTHGGGGVPANRHAPVEVAGKVSKTPIIPGFFDHTFSCLIYRLDPISFDAAFHIEINRLPVRRTYRAPPFPPCTIQRIRTRIWRG
jgi:hypothetical protein